MMSGENSIAVLQNYLEAYENYCKPLCRELGMPQMALDILLFLAYNPEGCTAKDISRGRGFKENILSVNVNKLVVEGYLERLSVEGDRRKVQLVCTQKAQRIIERGRAAQEAFFAEIYDGLTEEDREAGMRCLKVINENADRIKRLRF